MSSTNKPEESSGAQRGKRKKRKPDGFEAWGGYMASKKMKLNVQFEEQKDVQKNNEIETQIFRGVAIFVNGYTKPPADQLKKLMVIHGGKYHHYYSTTKTTHVIASNLPHSKMKNLKTQTVVTADWITDSIKAGKLLSHHAYLLYTPEQVDKQQRLQFGTIQGTKSETITSHKQSSELENEEQSGPTTSISDKPSLKTTNLLESNTILQLETLIIDAPHTSNTSPIGTPRKSSAAITARHPDFLSEFYNNDSPHTSYKSPIGTSLSPHKSGTAISGYCSSMIDAPHTSNTSPMGTPRKSSAAITARHPDFLSEFYNNSRLHHISTAGQELKRYVQQLAEQNKERHFPSREKLRSLPLEELPLIEPIESFYNSNDKERAKTQNVIMHLDMDCFFVSVGLKKHPELKGLPVAVTHAKGNRGGPQEGSDIHYEATHYANESKKKIGGVVAGRGTEAPDDDFKEKPKISIRSKEYGSLSEIASCSYEARKAGLRNGMFLGEALRRCPNLKTIPYDFEGYSEVSKQLYNIVAGYTLDIEAVSCDELYIDCKDLLQDTRVSPNQFASILRSEIEEKTGCTASAGIGPNMLIARLANKVAKPNGQHYVCKFEVENFMKKHKVGDLPGVGYSTSKRLEQLGVITCSDLQSWPMEKLQKEFGPKTGQSLFSRCRGNDNRPVQLHKDRKSVSAEINYGIRFETEADIYKFINELSVEVHNRLQSIGSKGKSLTLKLMIRKGDAPVETAKFMGHGVCDHFSKSVALKSGTDSSKVIADECCKIARSLKIKPQDYRGVGIQMSKLDLQKEVKAPSIMKSFLCQTNIESVSKSPPKNKTDKVNTVPLDSSVAIKPPPDKHSIKHFLSNKPVSQPKEDKLSEYLYGEPNQSFLDALPEDLREEVLKSCHRHSPAVKVDDLVPSCSNALPSETSLPLSNKQTEETNPNNPNQSFLDALPEDLRDEVLKSCHHNPPAVEVTDPVPSCSKALPTETLLPASKKQTEETNPNNLDQSVLNALPEELRKEVLESYGAPVETKKPSTSCGWQNLISLGGGNEPKSSTGSYVIIITDSGELKKVWSENPEIEYPRVAQAKKKKSANLGGAFEIDDIRSLLREWVHSTEEPFDDDVNDLNNFLMEAVAEESVCKAEMVLKYLHRLALSTTDKWKKVYLTVLSNVQNRMKELHRCALKAPADFPP